MAAAPFHVCLVTPGHLSTDPRLVKEADALVDAGYRVTTVSGRFLDWATATDREFESRSWARVVVPFGPCASRLSWLRQGLGRAVARALRDRQWGDWREQALHPVVGDLARAAFRVNAELFVGHNLAGLIAAGRAARRRGAALGFDAEDDHVGELPDQPAFAVERAHREALHRRWLPACVLLTAASPLMAARLEERYRRAFTPLLNVFPIASSDLLTPPAPPAALTFGWVSQTVGPGRGLDEVLEIVARMRSPASLVLRGRCEEGYRRHLVSRLEGLGIAAQRLRIEAPVAPGSVGTSVQGLALGLSPEISDTENRALCLGNKIFHFLLAGVPVLLSRTPAQAALGGVLGAAGLVVDIHDASATAARLDAWVEDREGRRRAHEAAWRLARERYCWDVEKGRFLEAVAAARRSQPA